MAEKKYMSLERLQEYDALVKQEIDGKADSGHTHKYAGSSSAGGAATSANKVNSSLTVKLNGGSTEGTNLFTFNGSAAKSVNITPSAIGAAASSHNHDDRYYTESEIDDKISTLNTAISGKSDSGHTHSISNVTNLQTTLDGKVPTTRTVNGKALSADITLTASDVGASASGHTHSAYVNQNAFSNVTVGDTTIAADSTTDTLTIAAGTGISVSADATNDKVTITNSGVRSISTGSSNGTISVNTNGSSANVAVKGLGSAAYTASTAYDAAGTAQTKADAALASAKSYTDGKISDLLDGADDATLDSIKELANAIKDNDSAIDALNTVASGKANATHSHAIADVSGLQSALDGKAASSHGTHVSFDSTNKPKMDGTAAFGTSSKVARADHIHPTDTSRAAKTDFDTHVADTTKHITSTERTNWGTAYTHSQAAHAPSNAQANQNAFSNIAVSGQTTVAADTTTDTVTFVGSNVSITTDATNDKVTFTVADGSTSAKGVVQLTNSTSSTSTTTAATPSSVKSAYDLANTAKTNAATAQTKADSAYTLAEGKVDSLSDLGITATATELNYVDGVTSGIQAQLDGKAASSHTHTIANITNLQTTLNGKASTSVATDSANGLMASTDKAKSDATNIAYGTCSTAAATAAKVVAVSGNTNWKLAAGSMITVLFSATNTAESPTLNVNSTGAKNIYYGSSQITTSSLGYAGTANRPMTFVYDGTQYRFIGWGYDSNTTYTNVKLGHGYCTCSTAADTVAKTASLSSYTLTTGGIVAVKFTYDVPASATLNINSKGAKAIYHKGAAITAGVIKAGDTATFIYSSQYHLISLNRDTTYSAAGSSLGLVKSGGDVTISDGVITVNDDSHNHTIANVDNLQTTLDGKAPTSHASTATTYGIGTSSNYGHVKLSDATNSTSSTSAGIAATPAAVKAAYDKANHSHPYLSTSGGTISGVITTTDGGAFNSDVTTSGTFYYGGTSFDDGAFLGLYGKDQSNYSGQFRLLANDGENFVYLEGMPSGQLRWNNKTVATLDSSGALAIADGGTGVRYEPSMLVNLASTSASGIFETYPRPGVTGVLGVANGGTGINNATPVVYASSKPSSPVTGVIYAIPI